MLALASICILYGCTDIFEKNLDFNKVTLLCPADSVHTVLKNITFWWDGIDGASGYNLQIASPSFSLIEILVLDTVITANKFKYSLTPGTYEWRVNAKNSSSFTPFTTFALIVDSVSVSTSFSPAINRQGFNYLSDKTLTRSFRCIKNHNNPFLFLKRENHSYLEISRMKFPGLRVLTSHLF
jgi:hypothetical protein